MNTYTRFLQKEEAHFVFKTYLKQHFPSNEVKPWKSISRMWDTECYFAIGIFEDQSGSANASSSAGSCSSASSDTASTPSESSKEGLSTLRGYAFFVESPDCDACLLDYYAILPEYRSSGLGGLSLQRLAETVCGKGKYILLETEDIDFAKNEQQVQERTRRDSFYTRNNCWKSDTKNSIFGVHYAVWALGLSKEPSEEALNKVCADMNALYQLMVPGTKFFQFVKIQRS